MSKQESTKTLLPWVVYDPLTEDEQEEIQKLKPGIYQDYEKIRHVAHHDGFVWVLDILADGFRRIKVRL